MAAEMGPDVDVFFPTFRSEVVNAFQSWLTGRGWSLVGAKDEGQIQARQPGGKTIVAVVGEHSAAQRQIIDHPDGRLLRAMNLARADSQHAIVVPQSLINRCLEVSAEVRASG